MACNSGDRKWFARIAAGAVIANTLIDIDPRYPTIDKTAEEKLQKMKKTLEHKRRRVRRRIRSPQAHQRGERS